MASRSDSSLAALLLAQRLVDGPVPALKAREYWSLLEIVPDPAVLLGLDASAVAARAGVSPELATRVAQLFDAAPALAVELEHLELKGVQVVASVDDGYPRRFVDRLGSGAPPLLYVVGDLALTEGTLLGIVGSRDVSESGAETTRQAARQAALNQVGVISGGAKGVDRLAMLAALDASTPVVGVLADSLDRVTRETDVRRAITDGALCLCTPYKPSAGFSVANAMGRNKLIYALSAATFVVAAETEQGGTWAGAVEALRQRSAPVVAWMGEGSPLGNRELVKKGATALGTMDRLFPLPRWPDTGPHPTAEQLTLT